MKISIVTTTYNSASTIADTLKSIVGQTYCDWELIVEDGKSTDDTLNICEQFRGYTGDRMKIFSEKDSGLYDAMNKGISRATGEIVGILNSDDIFQDENVLLDISAAFEKNSIDAIYGNLVFVRPNDVNVLVRIWRGSQYQPGMFEKGWAPAHPTFYCRREVYTKYGGFDTTLPVSADFDLMYRLIEKERISTLYIDRFFVRMRTGGESTGSLRNIIRGNRGILKVLKRNGANINPIAYAFRRLSPKLWGILFLRVYMLVYRSAAFKLLKRILKKNG